MPINFNLACAIHQHALRAPDAVAVVSQGVSLTYAELAQRAATLAHGLQQTTHWTRHDGKPPRVGILASRSLDACVALLGTCWAGASYVPIGLKLPEERMLSVLAQCDLSALVTDDAGFKLLNDQVLSQHPLPVLHVGATPAQNADGPSRPVIHVADLPPVPVQAPTAMDASDTAYIIFTSGTTGVPKGVMISAGAARHYLEAIVDYLGLCSSDRALETCELSFDFSVHNMFSCWQAGAALHILPATTVMNAVKFARQAGLTVWNSVPSLAGLLRQIKTLTPDGLPDLRVTVFGGEQLPAGVVAAWQLAAPNSAIVNLYGPTEATVFCTAQRVTHPLALLPGRDVVSIGSALPGTEMGVIDELGQFLPDGSPGELVIAGAQLAEGYLNAPELTAARFPTLAGQRWYRTGDLALRDPAGHLHCLARMDNQVKVLGYRVELEEIDAHVRAVTGADVVGTIAWPVVEGMARSVVCFVGALTLDPEAVIQALKLRLPPYMIPNQVIALEAMPLNTSGKVDRQALRHRLEELSAA